MEMGGRPHQLEFCKSSYSSSHGQNCVEVADTPGVAAVRDSQHRGEGHLLFPAAEWRSFLAGVGSGEF